MHVNFTELYNTAYAEIVNNTASFLVTKDMVIERFAELIVQECAGIACNTNLEDIEGGDSVVLDAASDQILKHFGVEP